MAIENGDFDTKAARRMSTAVAASPFGGATGGARNSLLGDALTRIVATVEAQESDSDYSSDEEGTARRVKKVKAKTVTKAKSARATKTIGPGIVSHAIATYHVESDLSKETAAQAAKKTAKKDANTSTCGQWRRGSNCESGIGCPAKSLPKCDGKKNWAKDCGVKVVEKEAVKTTAVLLSF